MAVSREAVLFAYKFFLRREPESEEVIRRYMEGTNDEDALAESFTRSKEFRLKVLESDAHESRLAPSLSTASRSSPPSHNSTSKLKIAAVGNCQVELLSKCMQAMTGDVVGETIRTNRLIVGELDLSSVLCNHDVVLIHPGRQMEKLIEARFAQSREKFQVIPRVEFAAFHPDLVYIRKREGGAIRGPVGENNSSLVFYGWMHGMSVSSIIELFADEVYRKLGFFEYWGSGRDNLLNEGVRTGFPLDDLFDSWARRGCFMYSMVHPKLFVTADLARAVLARLGISTIPGAEQFIHDRLCDGPVWPVYPEIGRRHGIEGNYLFKMPKGFCSSDKPVIFLSLAEFVEGSIEAFSKYRKEDLDCERLTTEPYRELETFLNRRRMAGTPAPVPATPAASAPEKIGENPYKDLPAYQFWRKAVENVALNEVDPVVSPGFLIDRQMKIATAGSCFSQHLSRTLARHGFNYHIAEKPAGLSPEEAARLNYGVFSARYGNIYTVRQLLQLFDRAYGAFQPADSAWPRGDGRYADPFRPQIEPFGFETIEAVQTDRSSHFSAVRNMFEGLDVLVFTLGLTEAWRAKEDGAVFPLAPGVVAGKRDFARYEFVNFGVNEVISDLEGFIKRLVQVNRTARIILTVSPVPLIATYEDRHVLVSTTYSKSVLRVAAEEIARRNSNCVYFPSYEIITGNYTRGAYYDSDLRSVNAAGVDHVMRLFLSHYSTREENSTLYTELMREAESVMGVVCDEEAI